MKNAMQLKAIIKNLAKEKHLSAQLVMQNFMLERLLERISVSKYQQNFILKGGFLIAAMVGLDTRATMDMDATIKGLPVNEQTIREMFGEICKIELDDDVSFSFRSIGEIRESDEYLSLIHIFEYINRMNEKTSLLYTIIDGKGLQKKIRINPHWRQLILDNYPVIYSWIQLKKIRFLQDRNPGVPGIIYKLERENNKIRKLHHARELWKSAVEIGGSPIYDIYSGKELDLKSYDLDHFVPRSYIANDELWNLTPMEKRLNSSKNNSCLLYTSRCV